MEEMHKYKTDIQGRSNKRWGPCLQRYQMNCHKQWPLLFPQINRMLNFVYLFYLCSWFSFLNGNTVMAVIWSLCIFLVCGDLFVGPFLVVFFFPVWLENWPMSQFGEDFPAYTSYICVYVCVLTRFWLQPRTRNVSMLFSFRYAFLSPPKPGSTS